MMFRQFFTHAVLVSAAAFFIILGLNRVAAAQGSAQLAAPGTVSISTTYRFITADTFHRQGWRTDGSPESKQSVAWTATAVVAEDLAIEVATSWGRFLASHGGSPSGGREITDGRQDTVVGVTWRVRNGQGGPGPTIATRVLGSQPGPYDSGYTNSLGDGASNLEASLILENFNQPLFGWTTQFGYRHRTDSFANPAGIGRFTDHHIRLDVPSEWFVALGLYRTVGRASLGIEYHGTDSRSGLDIGQPGWRSDRWPALQEDIHVLGARFDIPLATAASASVSAGRVVGGRNTPAYSIVTFRFAVDLVPGR